jgi:hypothetical protein
MRVEMSQGLPAAVIEKLTSDYCLASWHRFYIDIWRAHTTVAGVTALREGFEAFAAKHPAGVGLLTVVEAGAPVPPNEPRVALASFLAEAADDIKYSAVIYEGTGFRAATVRGIVIGLTTLARPPYPHKIFATVEQACLWFAQNFLEDQRPVATQKDMVAALAELRNRVRG